ncbi:hypothetical protein V8E54_010013 [Elaphomyces granulatus]
MPDGPHRRIYRSKRARDIWQQLETVEGHISHPPIVSQRHITSDNGNPHRIHTSNQGPDDGNRRRTRDSSQEAHSSKRHITVEDGSHQQINDSTRNFRVVNLLYSTLHPGMMKMLTILKASYSDEVFRKALAEVSDEAIEDDIEAVIREPKM